MSQTSTMLPALTEDVAKIQFNIGLTKSSITIQKLSDAEAALVYNEDNMQQIIDYISNAKKAKKVVKTVYDEMTEKAKQDIANALSVKKAFELEIDEPLARAESKLQVIQDAREKRRKDQEQKIQKDKEIKLGISKNLEFYSQQIADCDTYDKLRVVENRVNLEKANKNKYGDLYDEAKSAYGTLTDAIRNQKSIIKDKIELQEQLNKSTDDAISIKLMEEISKLDEKIDENKILVQEKAISTVMSQGVYVAEEILPEMDYKRRLWSWEVIDIKETAKRKPEWVETVPVKGIIADYLKQHKDIWNEKDETEVVVHGIKFIRTKKLA